MAYDEQALIAALQKADAAGNTNDAQQIADIIKQQRAAQEPQGQQPVADQPVQSLTQGPAGGDSALGAFLRSAGHELFGLGDVGRQLNTYLTAKANGHDLSWDDAGTLVRGQNAADEFAHTGAAYAGKVAGIAAAGLGGGTLEKAGADALSKAAPAVADAVGQVPVMLRRAAEGAVVGGGTGAAQTGTKEGAAIGAVGGAVGGAGVGAVGRVMQPEQAAFKLLAKKVRLPGESQSAAAQRLSDAFTRYKTTFGTNPALGELLEETQQAKALGKIIANPGMVGQGGDTAANIANAAEKNMAVQRQTTMSNAIGQGGAPMNATDMEMARNAAMDRVMQGTKVNPGIESTPVQLTPRQQDFLKSRVIGALNRSAPADTALSQSPKFYNQVAQDVDNGSLTVRQLDTIRRDLAKGSGNPIYGRHWGAMADEVEAIAANKVPEYAQALDDFHVASQGMRGAETGAALVGRSGEPSQAISDYDKMVQQNPINGAQGAQSGVKAALFDASRKSPNAAANTAEALAENAGMRDIVDATQTPAEAQRLKDIGTMQTRSARNMAALAPKAKDADPVNNAVRNVYALHGYSPTLKGHLVSQIVNTLRVPPGAAAKLAQMATDPSKTTQVIGYLRSRGIPDNTIQRAFTIGGAIGGNEAAQFAGGN